MKHPKKPKWDHVDVNGISILLCDEVRPINSALHKDDYTVTEIGKTKITITRIRDNKVIRLVPDAVEVI